MSVIVRPNKPVGGSGGATWVDGNQLPAAELNADIETVYTDHNGNIKDANCAADMALQGSKLASAPAGIPAGKYNAGSIANADIANLTIQKEKYSVTPGERITKLQLEVVTQEIVFSIAIGGALTIMSASVTRTTNAGNYETLVSVTHRTGGGAVNFNTGTVVPTTPIDIATKEIIGLYIADLLYSSPNATGKVVFVSIAKT